MKKKLIKLRKENGITLIALVITIIVLLILAGVSIAMLTGENGILSQAQKADVETRGAAVEEAKNLWETNKTLDENTGENTAESLEELVNRLVDENLLTEDEKDLILGNEEKGIEATGEVTIGSRTIVFGIEGPTIGSKYDEGAIKIGDKITYSANGQNNWIVFGKDENENILLTTEVPVENGFNLEGRVENWLNYEEDLKNACSVYGGTVQGKDVTSRSITMEDINRVTGFEKPDLSNYRYTFGKTYDYANKKVNYYYPSSSVSGYWQQPSATNTWTPGEEFDPYAYGYVEGKFMYETLAGGGETTINEENFKYVVGEGYKEGTFFSPYVVASRSVAVVSDYADFSIATVGEGRVYSYGSNLCNSDAEGGYVVDGSGAVPVRPIVILPSDLQVEETSSGVYDLVQ